MKTPANHLVTHLLNRVVPKIHIWIKTTVYIFWLEQVFASKDLSKIQNDFIPA